MPVEIKELVIRAVAAPDDERETHTQEIPSAMTPEQIQLIVQACVDEVMKIFERKESR